MIERALLVAAAAAVAVVAGLWLHSARLEDRAQSIANQPPRQMTSGQVADAVTLFQRARAHNPDARPIVLEAGLLERRGRHRDAITLLQPVVRREPRNLMAWVLLAIAASPVDVPLADRAVARARALNPLAAPGR